MCVCDVLGRAYLLEEGRKLPCKKRGRAVRRAVSPDRQDFKTTSKSWNTGHSGCPEPTTGMHANPSMPGTSWESWVSGCKDHTDRWQSPCLWNQSTQIPFGLKTKSWKVNCPPCHPITSRFIIYLLNCQSSPKNSQLELGLTNL